MTGEKISTFSSDHTLHKWGYVESDRRLRSENGLHVEFSLPVQIHSVELGRLGRRLGDVTSFHLVLDSVELVHTVQHVFPQDHANVVLSGLQRHRLFIWCAITNFHQNVHTHTGSHLHLCCRGTTRTCRLFLWSVCVCVFRLPCLQVAAATVIKPCRPSDPPYSLAQTAPRNHRLWISSGSQSGGGGWN